MDSKQVRYRHDEWYAVCKHCDKEFISGAATEHDAEFGGSKKGVRVFAPDYQVHMYCSTKCHEDACKPASGKPKWMPIPPLPVFYYNHFAIPKDLLGKMPPSYRGSTIKEEKMKRVELEMNVPDRINEGHLRSVLIDATQIYCGGGTIRLEPGDGNPQCERIVTMDVIHLLRGIVRLDDGKWAAFCCKCGKELTRGHDDAESAADACSKANFRMANLCGTYGVGRDHEIRTYCSATCEAAGEKRRDVMTKEKEMYKVVSDHDGAYGYTISDSEDEAISKLNAIKAAGSEKYSKWASMFSDGFRVESFTPTPEIDWLKITDDCANQKRWGRDAECAFCNIVRKENGSIECERCPLNIYAKSEGIESGVQLCGDLAREQRERMGLGVSVWDGRIFLPVLANLRIWLKSGGMKDEK